MLAQRLRAAAVVMTTVAAVATPAPATPPGDLLITLDLEAIDASPFPQGEPLRFRYTLRNATPVWIFGRVIFSLAPSAGGDGVAFEEWMAGVPGGGEVSREASVVSAQWFETTGAFTVSARGAFSFELLQFDVPLAELEEELAFSVSEPRVPPALFEDVTEAAGLATVHRDSTECDNYAAGAAWADVEADGDLDLYLPQRAGGSQLWINEAGSFVEGAEAAGVGNDGSVGNGAVFVDHDNDGDPDLYVVNRGPNRLYENDGRGSFTDVTARAGIGTDGPSTSAAWGDYDGDGYVDLYVTNHGTRVCGGEYAFQPVGDALYHNEGDGTFTDATTLLPETGGNDGLGFQSAWFDYDADHDLDLYVANDRIRPSDRFNRLWRNDGSDGAGGWTFTNVSDASGADLAMNSMGIAVGDPDRDADLDLAVSNIGATALLRNDADGTFTETGRDARVARPLQRIGTTAITWGIVFADLNNDGWEDLTVAAGDLETSDGQLIEQPNAVFVNARDGRFLDLSAPSGAAEPDVSRGIAAADHDRDGRVDLYVVNQAGAPRLYRNVTPGDGNWLLVDPVGTTSNRDGCGALVRAQVGDAELIRLVSCGSTSLASGSDPAVHFGLGGADVVDRLEIEWPSGATSVLTDVPAGRLITPVEP